MLLSSKIATELGWTPTETVEEGLHPTIEWDLRNRNWWQPLLFLTVGGILSYYR